MPTRYENIKTITSISLYKNFILISNKNSYATHATILPSNVKFG